MSRRLRWLVAVWTVPSLLLVSLTWSVQRHYTIDEPTRLSAPARAAAIGALRAALMSGADRAAFRPRHTELDRTLDHDGPVIVAIWLRGGLKARITATGSTIANAVEDAATQLAVHAGLATLSADDRRQARIKLDVVTGRAPLLRPDDMLSNFSFGILPAVGVQPGGDGIAVQVNGEREQVLLPDELIRGRVFMANRPMKAVPDFQVGMDFTLTDATLATLLRMDKEAYRVADRRYWRLRTDSFVEQDVSARDEAPLRLTRGMPPRPDLTVETLRSSALAGGTYLVAHLAANGRYIYQQNLSNGRGTDPNRPGPYSIPRHAGTTYFLAELYRWTRAEFLREPIERAFSHLEELIGKGGCAGRLDSGAEFACVIDDNASLDALIAALEEEIAEAPQRLSLPEKLTRAQDQKAAGLGSTALTVVALAEYKRATGSDRYMALARRLTEWILWMQRADGSFRHMYIVPRAEPVEGPPLLYYSGEAALALARMYQVTKEQRYADATERALDSLVDWYDFFVGGFLYGEEHWTCIAAEAIWPAVKKTKYRDFCRGYAQFLRNQQMRDGDFPGLADLTGAYGVSPFVMPHNTPAGSRSEAMISTYWLGIYHEREHESDDSHDSGSEAIRTQVLSAMHYVLGQQIRESSSWDVHPKARGIGAIPGSPVDKSVRIDYVQHVCSALIRSTALLEPSARPER